jgi:hypothetical protein
VGGRLTGPFYGFSLLSNRPLWFVHGGRFVLLHPFPLEIRPLVTITRPTSRRLKAFPRHAFGSRGPALCFTAAAGTLSVKANTYDTAVEYTEPGNGTAD